jgi:hypothetical protein
MRRLAPALALAAALGGAAMHGCLTTANTGANIYCDDANPCTGNPGYPVCDPQRHACVAASAVCTTAGCPDATPICDSMTASCRACAAGEDAQCAAHNPATPHCAGGRCVACLSNVDCTSNALPICDHGACRGCLRHTECPSAICLPSGACAVDSDIIYVSNHCDPQRQSGLAAYPFCELSKALTNLGSKQLVKIAPSTIAYMPVSQDVGSGSLTVTVVGPGKSAPVTATLTGAGVSAFVLLVGSGGSANVVLDGLELVGSNINNASGVECAGAAGGSASLTVRDSLIQKSSGPGVSSTACTLALDADIVQANDGGGLVVRGGQYTIRNDFIVDNHNTAAVFDATAAGTFQFNTVVNNNAPTGVYGGIDCGNGGAMRAIETSIVFGNAQVSGTQFAGNCQLSQVVSGVDANSMGIESTPNFVDATGHDYHLQPSSTCCIDQVTSSDDDHDVDLNHRPAGKGWDIGAHEVQ